MTDLYASDLDEELAVGELVDEAATDHELVTISLDPAGLRGTLEDGTTVRLFETEDEDASFRVWRGLLGVPEEE